MNKFHCLNISKRFNSNEELKESIINFFDKTMTLYHLLDSDYRISYLKDNDIYKISYNNINDAIRICNLINGMKFNSYGKILIIDSHLEDDNTIIISISEE